jgi:hypothetical protein
VAKRRKRSEECQIGYWRDPEDCSIQAGVSDTGFGLEHGGESEGVR